MLVSNSKPLIKSIILTFLLCSTILLYSARQVFAKPELAFIIDDIGLKPIPLKLSKLPKEISLSIIPFSKFDSQSAFQAYSEGREVMLHLPMQSLHYSDEVNALNLNMSEQEFDKKVYAALKRVPHAVAVNNHMGSKLTQHSKPMSWLMKILKEQQIGFIDSRTTAKTVAQTLAIQQGIANNRRHIFLDHQQNEDFITQQFLSAIHLAKVNKEPIIVIGHPHEITLRTLNTLLTKFKNQITLIPISNTLYTKELIFGKKP